MFALYRCLLHTNQFRQTTLHRQVGLSSHLKHYLPSLKLGSVYFAEHFLAEKKICISNVTVFCDLIFPIHLGGTDLINSGLKN